MKLPVINNSSDKNLFSIFNNISESLIKNISLLDEKFKDSTLHNLRINLRQLESLLIFYNDKIPITKTKGYKKKQSVFLKSLGDTRETEVILKITNQYLKKSNIQNISLLAFKNNLIDLKSLYKNILYQSGNLINYLEIHKEFMNQVRHDLEKILLDKQFNEYTYIKFSKLTNVVIKNILYFKNSDFSSNDLHKLRISLKKVRYITDFFNLRSFFPISDIVLKIVNVIGDIHDIDVICSSIDKFSESVIHKRKLISGKGLQIYKVYLNYKRNILLKKLQLIFDKIT